MGPHIFICRHAESLEDVDKSVYSILKDLDVPLTEIGKLQAEELGVQLGHFLEGKKRVKIYTSPGVRNLQTLEIVLPKLPKVLEVNVEVEPLIVKQDWGDINSVNRPLIEADRYKAGVLRYAFPTGESAESLISRLGLFKRKAFHVLRDEKCDVVVFSHGFEFRVLLMLIMGWDEEVFESFGNLKNCEFRILSQNESGTFDLDRPLKKHGQPITRLSQ